MRMPPWVSPYHFKLDWQMWFAALSTAQQTPWFQRMVLQLLRGSDAVQQLFQRRVGSGGGGRRCSNRSK